MHPIEKKALYNALRMNWLIDKSLNVEPWQVDDYRLLSLDEIFKRLEKFHVILNKTSFVAYADSFDTPEEFADSLVSEESFSIAEQDEIYLLIFELWRRLFPEKLSLSIFCDEFDHLINLYDQGNQENLEAIQDAFSNFKNILDENIDAGGKPQAVFSSISKGFANDVEQFLYDFIAEQIDQGNLDYASELLENFYDHIQSQLWFECLRVHLLSFEDKEVASLAMKKLIEKAKKEKNFDFNLEILSLMVKAGERGSFSLLVKHTLPLMETEEDFRDLLTICIDYMHYLDHDNEQAKLEALLSNRQTNDSEDSIDLKDPQISELITVLDSVKGK